MFDWITTTLLSVTLLLGGGMAVTRCAGFAEMARALEWAWFGLLIVTIAALLYRCLWRAALISQELPPLGIRAYFSMMRPAWTSAERADQRLCRRNSQTEPLLVSDGGDVHMEPVRSVSESRIRLAALSMAVIPNGMAALLPLGPPVQALTRLISPLFAGLIAGNSSARPIFQGATACAMGTLFVLLGIYLISGEFPTAGRDRVPAAFVVAYATAAGAFGAWIASRGRLFGASGLSRVRPAAGTTSGGSTTPTIARSRYAHQPTVAMQPQGLACVSLPEPVNRRTRACARRRRAGRPERGVLLPCRRESSVEHQPVRTSRPVIYSLLVSACVVGGLWLTSWPQPAWVREGVAVALDMDRVTRALLEGRANSLDILVDKLRRHPHRWAALAQAVMPEVREAELPDEEIAAWIDSHRACLELIPADRQYRTGCRDRPCATQPASP